MSKETSKSGTYQATEEERVRMKAEAKARGIDLGLRGDERVRELREQMIEQMKEQKNA